MYVYICIYCWNILLVGSLLLARVHFDVIQVYFHIYIDGTLFALIFEAISSLKIS